METEKRQHKKHEKQIKSQKKGEKEHCILSSWYKILKRHIGINIIS